ncbi:MAG: zinc ribbon domain-containing protein [Planctomycetaceae bacterium]|jgi:putative FmdB family regulatory protein|nr:zinc ribbon domain-containing protein [Planctomycetaceae bacterium]
MPTYDYHCDACGHEFEEFQYIKEEPLHKCPKCNKLKLRRLIGSGAAIMFKGNGFYQTDYRSESYKKGESAAKTNAPSSAVPSGNDKKNDSKPADSKPTVSPKAS